MNPMDWQRREVRMKKVSTPDERGERWIWGLVVAVALVFTALGMLLHALLILAQSE